jgi:hypothetical protein
MNTQKLKLSDIRINPNNPRFIRDDKFTSLVKSIKDFPEMLDLRPIVVNKDMVILGGNMRFKACKEAGIKEVPVIVAENLTEEQEREFLIKDNVSGGEWDWDILANEWESESLKDWGLDVPSFGPVVDYSILEDPEADEELSEMTAGVKKAIQIEFEAEHYENAYEMVKFWRERKAYVGGMIMEHLKAERDKI